MNELELEKIADEAKASGNSDLAIVIYTYLGSEKVGMGSEFARYCQEFAREGIKQIEFHKNRRNNSNEKSNDTIWRNGKPLDSS